MTTSIPADVKQPEDHQVPNAEAVIPDDELLAGMPPLTPPTRLRLRQRNKLMKLAFGLRSLIPEGEDGIDTDNLPEDDLIAFLDTLAQVDEFAESIAENQAAYIEWAQGAGYEQFTALLGRYASAVGESNA